MAPIHFRDRMRRLPHIVVAEVVFPSRVLVATRARQPAKGALDDDDLVTTTQWML